MSISTDNNKSFQRQLGKVIAEMRETRGMSQVDFSHRSGIAQKYISDLENGKRNISIGILCKIAETLEISLSSLFFATEEYIRNDRY